MRWQLRIDKSLGLKSGKLRQLGLLKSALDSYYKLRQPITDCDEIYILRQMSLLSLSQAASLSSRIFIEASRAAFRS